ncbi:MULTISPECIES: hypothetical protein [Bacillus]|uniref:hypothetical protein n=1 Tax=Bacillus TaxID=1386 RepID=UPI0002F036D3|nr:MULTISPECIES: hypothetical protein [Bacillus]
MNTLEKAKKELEEFMNSNQKVVLIKGTHQFKKHLLALHMIGKHSTNSKVLFRCNTLRNAEDFLQLKRPAKTGEAYIFQPNHQVYLDTNRSFNWRNTPKEIDYSILYPIDSICDDSSKIEIIEDIINRSKQKIFLVSWTDSHDYTWLQPYLCTTVIYDAEKEDPIYHQKVLDCIKELPQ